MSYSWLLLHRLSRGGSRRGNFGTCISDLANVHLTVLTVHGSVPEDIVVQTVLGRNVSAHEPTEALYQSII